MAQEAFLENQSLSNEIHYWVDQLGLLPHPEGGFYKETYRSFEKTAFPERSLCTCIYFLLTSENVSRFHRIKSDEHWFYHAGSPLTVHMLTEKGHEQLPIGTNLEAGQTPFATVPKNTIFGSSVQAENSYSLVSCVVAPGFDFADFELFERDFLLQAFPGNENIILKLT